MIPALLLAAVAALLPGDEAREAEALLAAGKPAEARSLVERALEAGPEREIAGVLHEVRARCLAAEGSLWDAEAAFAAALEARPGWDAAMLGRGKVYLSLAREAAASDRAAGAEVRALAADALRWLGGWREKHPEDDGASLLVAEAHLLDRDFRSAAEILRALASAREKDAPVRHALAAALRGAGDRAGAAKAEAEALALDPRLPGAAALRVEDLAATGADDAARAAALEALLADPDAEEVYRALWRIDGAAKRHLALEETLVRVLAKHPDHPKALHYLGYAQIDAGRLGPALDTFRRKAEREPESPGPALQVGRLLVARQDPAGAEKEFERALALGLDPEGRDHATALEGLSAVGVVHGQARRFADAERIFRRLAELDPGNPRHRMYLGLSLRRLGKYAEAERAYREAVERSSFDGSAWNELGLLYLGWGKAEAARAAFEASAKEDPRITAPLENLGILARLAGRHAASLDFFREALRRAREFRDEDDARKFRRYLDVVARERDREAGAGTPGGR
jgi:tetratricopeptide (TPR) repeat protein